MVRNKPNCLKFFLDNKIEIGEIIQYSIPEMSCYRNEFNNKKFPNSSHAKSHVINLPLNVNDTELEKIIISAKMYQKMGAFNE